jgi:hypothetical protein
MGCNGINVRGGYVLASVEAHVRIAKIIRHDDDEVWRSLRNNRAEEDS